jgi:Peptidase MA superfamily
MFAPVPTPATLPDALMLRRLLKYVVFFWVALAVPSGAHAQSLADGELLPSDVGVAAQPSSASLPPLPQDFQRIDRGWLALEFPASVRERVEPLASDAEMFRNRLSEDLGQPVLEHVLVRIARTPGQMAELAPRTAQVPKYAAGVAYPYLRVALLSLQAPVTWEATDLVVTLRHELAHVALDDATANHHVPRWFNEGLAMHESGELRWSRLETLWHATLANRLLPLVELDQAFPSDGTEVGLAYAESADVVRFLMRDSDRARFGSLIQRLRGGAVFDRALEDAYGTDVRKLEYEWREDVGHHFGLLPVLTGGGFIWTLTVGLAVAAWIRKQRRAKAKLALWAREEAEADAAMAAVRATRPADAGEPVDPASIPARIPSVPVVEHEGRWYTLH